LTIAYDRTRGKVFGTAIPLPPQACAGVERLVLRARAERPLRVTVCATDDAGIVWTFPTVRLTDEVGSFELRLAELAPDRFQNQGKTPPAKPDPTRFVLLTLLDLAGPMGGAEEAVSYDIESLEAVLPAAPTAGVDDAALRSRFYDALNRDPSLRTAALAALDARVAEGAPGHMELLAGLGHLWVAAEASDERRDSLVRAVELLARAERALPDDDRIVSWLAAAEWGLASLDGRGEDRIAARDRLAVAALRDPCFHAIALGLTSFDEPRDSDPFRAALAAMRAAFDCRDGSDPSATDHPRWPNNVRGFLVALADFELKAGDLAAAETALVIAESRAGFDTWRFRHLVDERLGSLRDRRDLYADADPSNDPRYVFAPGSAASCLACHAH
jgi:hypothetical protein